MYLLIYLGISAVERINNFGPLAQLNEWNQTTILEQLGKWTPVIQITQYQWRRSNKMCRNVRGKSRKLRSGFCEVGYCPETFCKLSVLHLEISGFYSERWLIKVIIHSRNFSGIIYRKHCDIWIKVSFRSVARQFISSCVLIKNSCWTPKYSLWWYQILDNQEIERHDVPCRKTCAGFRRSKAV